MKLGLGNPWIRNREALTEEVALADARVDKSVCFVQSCCIDLLHSKRRLPYEAKRFCVAACHTFESVRDVLPSERSVPRLVCAVVAVLVQIFVTYYRLAII